MWAFLITVSVFSFAIHITIMFVHISCHFDEKLLNFNPSIAFNKYKPSDDMYYSGQVE